MPTANFRDEVHVLLGEGARLVDVLLREEYEDEHLPGAIRSLSRSLTGRRPRGLSQMHRLSSTATTTSET